MIKKPEMIIFDYGQTLVKERPFDGIKGTEALLQVAEKNPNKVTAAEINSMAIELNKEVGRFGLDYEKMPVLEIHNHAFQNYLYEYFDIQFNKSPAEMERIFWDTASDGEPTENIDSFLSLLDEMNIRTSIISNISFSGEALRYRINRLIPSHKFEFIIASSEYLFRKPHKRIFELALKKANLKADEVWYIGDNAVFDVDGASNCGIFAVWYKGAINRSFDLSPKMECIEINDWNELMGILNEIRL